MDLYALRLRSQLGDGQSGWRQHMVVTAIGIASEEMLRHSKPCGQPEHDIGVGPRLTDPVRNPSRSQEVATGRTISA